MFLVVLADHLAASHLESFFATFRPPAALGHNIGQHIEGLWVREQSFNSLLLGQCDEFLSISDVRPCF